MNFLIYYLFNLKLLYRASKDGSDFHRKCDNHNNTLTVIQDINNFVYGGFASVQWNVIVPEGSDKIDHKSFIFAYKTKSNEKIKINYESHKIFCKMNYGPSFDEFIRTHEPFNNALNRRLGVLLYWMRFKEFHLKKYDLKEIEVYQIDIQ